MLISVLATWKRQLAVRVQNGGRRRLRPRSRATGPELSAAIQRLETRELLSAISGTKWNDLDADGTRETGEPGLEGVVIYLDMNGNGTLDSGPMTNKIEPDAYTPGTILDAIHPAVTLSALDGNGDPVLSVQSVFESVTTDSGNVFGHTSNYGAEDKLWSTNFRSLRADFHTPTSSVSIHYTSYHNGAKGVLRAYDTAGNLLDTYETPSLDSGQEETMTVSDPNIAYVVATAEDGMALLDTLQFSTTGSDVIAVTDSNGDYAFTGLDAGEYVVREVVPEGYVQTSPVDAAYTITLAEGQAVTDVDFGNVQNVGDIGGTVFDDADGNGLRDAGESGLADVTVYFDQNQDGQFGTEILVEPDDFAHGQPLNEAVEGITLSVADLGNQTIPSLVVRAIAHPLSSTGDKMFAWGGNPFWPHDRRLRADFDQPASYVSIDFTASDDGQVGMLEAYNASGELLASYTTKALTPGSTETMSIELSNTEIAYVVAYTSTGIFGRLDNLRFGVSEPSAVTDANGNYAFTEVPSGEYLVRQVVPEGYVPTTSGSVEVTVTAGTSVTDIDFGNLQDVGTIEGAIFDDVDGDGVRDAGELGMNGVTVYLDLNEDGQFGTETVIEPDDFADFAPLNDLVEGVAFSVADSGNESLPSSTVWAFTHSLNSTGDKVLAWDGAPFWPQNRRLRADFDESASYVSIDFIAASSGQVGKLEAYSASGELLASYTTAALTGGDFETMSIELSNAEIAYVVAYTSTGVSGRLDNLRFGATEPSTVTDTNGDYTFTEVPSGEYLVRQVVPEGYVQTSPTGSGTRLFATIATQNGSRIAEIDPVSGAILGSFPVPTTAAFGTINGLAFDGETLYLVDSQSNRLIEIDPDTGTVLDSIPLADDRWDGVAVIDGLVYVNGPLSNVIQVIDPATNATVRTIPFGPASNFAPFGALGELTRPDGSSVLVGSIGLSNSVVLLDPMTGAVIDTFTHPLGIAGDDLGLAGIGEDIYLGFTNFNGLIQVYDAAGDLQRSISVGAPISGLAGHLSVGPVYRVTVTVGASVTDIDFGNLQDVGTIGGAVFDDLNGDGVRDADELGMEGVTVYLDLNEDGQFGTETVIEPDDFADFAPLNDLVEGVAFSVADSGNESLPSSTVWAFTHSLSSTGEKMFAWNGAPFWPADRRLRADFDESASYVSIDFIAASSGQVGMLEAYSASGELLASYTTAALTGGDFETMSIELSNAEIAYVVAYTSTGDFGRLDNLRFGVSEPVAVSDTNGDYAFAEVPSGEYLVRQVVPEGYVPTTPGAVEVTVTAGGSVTEIDFGNLQDVGTIGGTIFDDVDGDGVRDVGELGMEGVTVYLDVNGDGQFGTETVVEPDDFAHGTLLKEAIDGVTFSVANLLNESFPSMRVQAFTHSLNSTGDKVFAWDHLPFWPHDRRLRADFDESASYVSIDFIAANDGQVGMLEAYSASGELLASYTTKALTPGSTETMSIELSNAEIAYVVAYTSTGVFGRLDNLRFGVSEPVAVSDTNGEYAFTEVPSGEYLVRQVVPEGYVPTTPGAVEVTVTAGGIVEDIDFGNLQDVGTIGGTIFDDVDGDGVRDAGELGMEGVTVYLDVNGDGQLETQRTVEPDDFAHGEPLNEAVEGITLSVVDPGNQTLPSLVVRAIAHPLSSTGDKMFAWGGNSFWPHDRRLRADFDESVSYVSIAFTASNNGQVGMLEAYSASGELLASYTTKALTPGSTETMSIELSNAEIAYVVAYTSTGVFGRLDNLRIGVTEPSVVTDTNGDYAFIETPSGEYLVRAIVPEGYVPTTPTSETIIISAGETVTGIDFGNLRDVGTVQGTTFEDLDGDGLRDVGEPGLDGVTVYLDRNGNGQLDTRRTVEPDAFANGEPLNEAVEGVTLSVADLGNQAIPSLTVRAYPHPLNSTGGKVFAWDPPFWPYDHRLRADFDQAVSYVSLDFIAGSSSQRVGTLLAYDATGTLLASYTTEALTDGQVESMTIELSSAEIAYVVAYTSTGIYGFLDNLQFGISEPVAVSDTNGDYTFTEVPSGEYLIRAIVPEGYVPTTPTSETIIVSAGETVTGAAFGIRIQRPPVARPGGPYVLPEGESLALDASASSDPDGDPLTYAWDLDNDGQYDDAVGVVPTMTWAELADLGIADDGTFSIGLRVVDRFGAISTNGSTIVVVNENPEITTVGNTAEAIGDAAEGDSVHVSASFTDAGALDTHTAVIDWGDGTSGEVIITQGSGFGSISADHAYEFGGVYTIELTLTDDDGGTDVITTTAYVTGVGVHGGVLQIVGTGGDDEVRIYERGNGRFLVRTDFLPDRRRTVTTDVESIQVFLGDGDDEFNLSRRTDLPLVVDAGSGDDVVNAATGRSILIGGQGDDRFRGGRDQDILIGGTTDFDGDADALGALLAEWASSRSLKQRVANLYDGSGSGDRANGDRFLTVDPNGTVHEDDDADTLRGGRGLDWFFFDPQLDEANDLWDELFANDLDWLLTAP